MEPIYGKNNKEVFGHATSVSLENEFWQALQDIADNRQTSVSALIAQIDENRTTNLSSAIRVFILKQLQNSKN